MPFIPPVFSILRVNTLNLDTRFSTKLGRYNIEVPKAAKDSSDKPPTRLEVLIASTQQVIDCKTDRKTARDVFSKLVIELGEVVKTGTEAEKNTGVLFLLGALLHRYFRLINEYSAAYTNMFVKTSDVRNCDLFQAIRAALKLPKEMPSGFKLKDLEVLDVTTVVTALEVFRDNMLQEVDKVPRYKKYPHLAKDVNFERYLQAIIIEQKGRGAAILKEFKAVTFIQSLAAKIEAQRVLLEEELDKWSKILKKDHPDFSSLSFKSIENHIIKKITVESAREKILDLLYTGHIITTLESFDHASFLIAMKKCQTDKAIYIVFGGYALLLQSKKDLEKLEFCIYQALNIESKPKELTNEDMLVGIQLLKEFIETNPEIVLNYDFFGGKDKMNTEISQREEALILKVKEEKALALKVKEEGLAPKVKEEAGEEPALAMSI
jgi:hypothetical protein